MRDIVVDLWKTTRFNMGYVGEDEATRLIFQLTTDLMESKTFTIEFNINGEITVINDISPTDNSIIYVVPEIFTTAEGDVGIQVVGYNDGKVIKSPVVYGRISKSQVGDSGIPLKAYHTHDNKNALDKFGEDEDGNPTYNGEPIGGENTIYIPATLNMSGDSPTIETSVTFEQIDTAYRSGQVQILKVGEDDSGEGAFLMPIILAYPGSFYYFGMTYYESSMIAVVMPTDDWSFSMNNLIDQTTEEILPKLKPSHVTKWAPTSVTLADNTEYRFTHVSNLTITYPSDDFECWMRIEFFGNPITVTFPTNTSYIGTLPDFKDDETWELSIKDGVVIAQKVGDGT